MVFRRDVPLGRYPAEKRPSDDSFCQLANSWMIPGTLLQGEAFVVWLEEAVGSLEVTGCKISVALQVVRAGISSIDAIREKAGRSEWIHSLPLPGKRIPSLLFCATRRPRKLEFQINCGVNLTTGDVIILATT